LSIVIASALCNAHAADCSVADRDAVLASDIKAFDRTPGAGWRLLEKDGCFFEAAQLIAEYAARNGRSYALSFHAAQLLLKADRYSEAREQLMLSYRRDATPDQPLRWNEFVDAYVAFVDKDTKRLLLARGAIAARSDFWGNAANLRVVDLMLGSPNSRYIELFP
jgi:hypothetical protein